tara:strand:+ start:2195 stop:2650 length:456 start_codon:yes stop_codon:yes gene_type:complete
MEIINKKFIYDDLVQNLKEKLNSVQFLISSAIESRDLDVKSSAGDKHETSRAKIQSDIDNYSKQELNIIEKLKVLGAIDINKKNNKVENGALVETNVGFFFIAIGLGRWKVNNEQIFVISLASPIGKFMKDKVESSSYTFRNLNYKIIKIT